MESTTAPVPVPVAPLEEAIAAERAFLESTIADTDALIAKLQREKAALASDLCLLNETRIAAMASRISARVIASAQIVPVQPIDKAEVAAIIASVPGALEEAPAETKEQRVKRLARNRQLRRKERLKAASRPN